VIVTERFTVHSALRQPPAMAWEHGIAQRVRPVRHPQDRERFFLDFLPSERGRSAATVFVYFTCTTGTIFSVPNPVVSGGNYWSISRFPTATLLYHLSAYGNIGPDLDKLSPVMSTLHSEHLE
jgi:hypothetical protein